MNGLHVHFLNYDRQGKAWNWPPKNPPVIGLFDILRLHDSGASWASMNPAPGVYDWLLMDRIMAFATHAGVPVIWTLHDVPSWAAADQAPFGYGPGSQSAPKDMQDWRNFCMALVSRYKGRIQYYEGMNEWGHNSMTAGVTANMQKVLWNTVKTIDPKAKVLSPSSPHWQRLEEIWPMIQDTCDIVSHHFYGDTVDADAKKVVSIQNQKPVWNTEFGWLKPTPFSKMPRAQQRQLVKTQVQTLAKHGINVNILHSWNGVMGFAG